MASFSNSLGERTCLCNPSNSNSNSTTTNNNSTSTVAGSTNSSLNSSNTVAGTTIPPNSVAGSTSSGSLSSTPSSSNIRHNMNSVKCKMCRSLKPKFSFLRSQRSLDLCHGSPVREMSSKEAEAAQREAAPRGRRARSAERYDGMRIADGRALPRQTSLQNPLMSAPPVTTPTAQPPVSSPPPTYEVAVAKSGLPPSYDEYLSLRGKATRGVQGSVTPPPPWTQHTAQTTPANKCPCARCKSSSQARGLRVSLPDRQLRVTLPTDATNSAASENTCPCSKCQPRYNSYSDTANVNTAVLISLDTTTAMHSVLADGIALCSLM